jgi:molecular chaperone IbpA
MNISKVNTTNLHDLINSLTIGFDNMLQPAQLKSSNFPPHNIIRYGENTYCLEFALAGFSKKDIEVQVEDNILTITGSNQEDQSEKEVGNDSDQPEYLHRGIASRSFSKSFTLGQDINVKGGSMENGILQVNLERIIPDHKKPQLIKLK